MGHPVFGKQIPVKNQYLTAEQQAAGLSNLRLAPALMYFSAIKGPKSVRGTKSTEQRFFFF